MAKPNEVVKRSRPVRLDTGTWNRLMAYCARHDSIAARVLNRITVEFLDESDRLEKRKAELKKAEVKK